MHRVWFIVLVSLVWSACQTARPRVDYGSLSALLAAGRMFEAEAVLRQDGRHPLDYAEMVLGRDDLPEAEGLARDALRADPGNQRARLVVARAHERHGDWAVAVPVFAKLHDAIWLCRAALDANQRPEVCAALRGKPELEAFGGYAAWLLQAGQPAVAEAALHQALARAPERGAGVRTVSRLHYELAVALRDQRQAVAAEAEFWRALALQREVLGGSLYLADTLFALGAMKLDQGWPASIQPFLREALEIRGHLLAPHDWRVAQARGALAACLRAERRFGQAGSDLRQAYETVARERGASAPEAVQLRAWGQAQEPLIR